MDFSGISTVVGNYNVLGVVLVLGVLIWKFIIQPIVNEQDPVPKIPGMEIEDSPPEKRKTSSS